MNSLKIGADAFRITLTRHELLILCRCIRETRRELPDWEFPIRVGAAPAEADAIQTTLLDAARINSGGA